MMLYNVNPENYFYAQNGSFDKENWSSKPSTPTSKGTAIGAAIAARVTVPPGEKREVVFSLAWDSPEVKFLKGKSYHRYDLLSRIFIFTEYIQKCHYA